MLQQEFNKAEKLVMQLKAYIHSEIALAKLTVAEKVSKVISNFLAVIFVVLVFFLFIFFASLAMAWLVGELLGKIWVGFLIVALFYLLTGIIAWYAREKLLRIPIMNAIIRQLFNRDEADKNTRYPIE